MLTLHVLVSLVADVGDRMYSKNSDNTGFLDMRHGSYHMLSQSPWKNNNIDVRVYIDIAQMFFDIKNKMYIKSMNFSKFSSL